MFRGTYKSNSGPMGSCPVLIACRYFEQRYDLWTRYDDGILMTDDAWFGVTPENVAR